MELCNVFCAFGHRLHWAMVLTTQWQAQESSEKKKLMGWVHDIKWRITKMVCETCEFIVGMWPSHLIGFKEIALGVFPVGWNTTFVNQHPSFLVHGWLHRLAWNDYRQMMILHSRKQCLSSLFFFMFYFFSLLPLMANPCCKSFALFTPPSAPPQPLTSSRMIVY